MSVSPLIQELIQALRYLPGVGPKSAQRMAFYLLQNDIKKTEHLANTIIRNLKHIRRCIQCRVLTETELCQICRNTKRAQTKICIVEGQMDTIVIEQTATFNGRYFVLHGQLSPIDGIGPEQIGIPLLLEQIKKNPVDEVILALSATIEGQTTSHYIASALRHLPINITRLAHGLPMGSELEYTDGHTLTHAFMDRKNFAFSD
ncbi:MAG: recombination mediator RecR [Gammaproteobacteria bacterium]|nr:recombination mediator RecR [Gammaproteobacteria bacterium]